MIPICSVIIGSRQFPFQVIRPYIPKILLPTFSFISVQNFSVALTWNGHSQNSSMSRWLLLMDYLGHRPLYCRLHGANTIGLYCTGLVSTVSTIRKSYHRQLIEIIGSCQAPLYNLDGKISIQHHTKAITEALIQTFDVPELWSEHGIISDVVVSPCTCLYSSVFSSRFC